MSQYVWVSGRLARHCQQQTKKKTKTHEIDDIDKFIQMRWLVRSLLDTIPMHAYPLLYSCLAAASVVFSLPLVDTTVA